MNWLFDTSRFINKMETAIGWPNWLINAYIISSLIIACSFIIYVVLWIISWKNRKNDVTDRISLYVVGIVIIFNALLGFLDIMAFWVAPYHLITITRCTVAIFILVAISRIRQLIIDIMQKPSPFTLQEQINEKTKATDKADKLNERLMQEIKSHKSTIETLKEIIDTNMWAHDKAIVLRKLEDALEKIKNEIE